MKSKVLLLSGMFALLLSVGASTQVSAKEVKKKDGQETYYIVEEGDSLSSISEKYKMNHVDLHAVNFDKIDYEDLIFVGQELEIREATETDMNKLKARKITLGERKLPKTTPVEEVVQVQEEVVAYVEPVTVQESYSQVPQSNDNWHRANRRMVETTDNYQWDWSNGYKGAYQFSEQTWNATASAHGLNPNDHSPANQDAMADAYANDRYGGWHNVPTTGGW